MNCWKHVTASLVIGLGLLLAVCMADLSPYNVKSEYDICNPKTEVNYPSSVYLPSPESSTEVYVNWTNTRNQPANINCLLYFKTCDNCRIEVKNAGNYFSYPSCSLNVSPSDDTDDVCIPNCVYFYLFDADYRSQTATSLSASVMPLSFMTESKQLHVIACGLNYNHTIRMRLKVTAKEKLKEINYKMFVLNIFTSPYFPSPYAKNSELYTFKLQVKDPTLFMLVSFDDWMITPSSYFVFHDAKDVFKVMGTYNRPFVQSLGQNMTVDFYTGEPTSGQSSYLGFKATVTNMNSLVFEKPSTACDQDISSEGGSITMTIADGQLKDCIFVIRKMSRFDGVYLRVLKNPSAEPTDLFDYNIDIHNGITSQGELKIQIQRHDVLVNNTVLLSSDGFYVRFRGRYSSGPSHVLVYAMYVYDCNDYRGYFQCKNDLCISLTLKCDGYDHCGDGSDEYVSLCSYETTHSSSSYPISIGVIIPLVVSVFLIIVVCVLIIFIRRCRRLSNSARNRRPPGFRPGTNRQRSRHNRDVQMSVTVRSGEHPPSYDEVLQSTPIGYLNMAFTWSQHGNNLTQPPSYEEAVSPTSQQNGSIIITATANNGISHEEANRNLQQNSSTVLTTTILASLDPRAEVSSSSSSDDAPDRFRQLDFSSSSDSSTENEHRLTATSHNIDNSSRSNTIMNKASKGFDNDIGSRRSFPKYGSNDGVQVVLGSPGSAKLNSEGQERLKLANNQRKEESDGSRNLNNAGRNQFHVKEVRDLQRSFGDLRGVSDDRESQGLHPSERRFDGSSGEAENHTVNGSEGLRDAQRESKQGRERVDMYHKNRAKHSHRNGDRIYDLGQGQGTYSNNGLNMQPPKVRDSSRSQSCFDLSLGNGAVRLLDGSSARMHDEDKRFSYAGAGDTSLARKGLEHFYTGRGLIREKPLEHLDRYASQSYDNVRDGNTIRTHDTLNYQTGNDFEQHRHSRSSDSPGYFPKSTRDKTDSLKAKGQYSSLAPVQENLNDETYTPASVPEATHRYTHSEHTDDQLTNTSQSNSSQYRRNPPDAGRESSPAHASSQKTNLDTRGPSREHLPGSTRSWPSDRMAVTSGHNYVNKHDHRKPSSDEGNRKQAKLPSNRNHFGDIHNLNANSSKNVTSHSAMQNDARSSRDNGSAEERNKVPQSGQDTDASMFKPKPSLRKSRMKTPQRSDGDLTEPLPNSSSQGPTQGSQRPVPAPRHGVKKLEPFDDKGSQYDAQQTWGIQGSNRQHERGDERSVHPAEQRNPRDHINVEATKDDVFV